MNFQSVLYWMTIFILWVLIGWSWVCIFRNRRLNKKLEKLSEMYEDAIERYNNARDAYYDTTRQGGSKSDIDN